MTELEKNTKSKKKKHICQMCRKELSKDEVYELEGMILCEDCCHVEENLRAITLESLKASDSELK